MKNMITRVVLLAISGSVCGFIPVLQFERRPIEERRASFSSLCPADSYHFDEDGVRVVANRACKDLVLAGFLKLVIDEKFEDDSNTQLGEEIIKDINPDGFVEAIDATVSFRKVNPMDPRAGSIGFDVKVQLEDGTFVKPDVEKLRAELAKIRNKTTEPVQQETGETVLSQEATQPAIQKDMSAATSDRED